MREARLPMLAAVMAGFGGAISEIGASWLKDQSLGDAADLPEPEDLVSEAVTQLETALDALRDLALRLQENGK